MKAPTSQDNLWVAAGDGQLDRVRELLETGIDVNSHDQFGYTAMHAAVSYGQFEIVKYLLEKGANVNVEDFEKDTPLYVAETVEMAQLLLDHGADPHKRNEDGISPAATAYEEGWDEVAHLLAAITHEELVPTDDAEEDSLAHINQEEDDEMSEELHTKIGEIMKRIEEQGGAENEDELREMVTKMVLDEMQRSLNEIDDTESQ